MRLLSNPAIPASARIEVLGRLMGDDVTGAPRNLLALLVSRGRIESLPAVRREFTRLYHRREGILEATVTSAAELSPAEVEALRERLVALTGQPPRAAPAGRRHVAGRRDRAHRRPPHRRLRARPPRAPPLRPHHHRHLTPAQRTAPHGHPLRRHHPHHQVRHRPVRLGHRDALGGHRGRGRRRHRPHLRAGGRPGLRAAGVPRRHQGHGPQPRGGDGRRGHPG